MEVPLAMQGLDSDDLDIISQVFASGNHTMGSKVKEFENQFAKFIGTKYAVMVNSGSSANLLALEVATRGHNGLLKNAGGKLIAVPAVLWPTSLWPIIQLGFRVLIIDTQPNSLMIDFNQLREAKKVFSDELVGVVLIHPLGKSLDLQEVKSLKDELGLFVIEDTAESLGSGNHGKYSGSVGTFGTFSFYFSHHITTVEGGMVVTDNLQDYDDLISMRAHGWTRNRSDKVQIERKYPNLHKDFLFKTSGYNFRPMEFQGALGTSQLRKFPDFLSRRLVNATKVASGIEDTPFEILDFFLKNASPDLVHAKMPVHSSMALPIRYKNSAVNVTEVMRFLQLHNIANRPLLAGNVLFQPAFKHECIVPYGNLENASSLYQQSFMIGNHHNYSSEQIEKIVDVLIKFSE